MILYLNGFPVTPYSSSDDMILYNDGWLAIVVGLLQLEVGTCWQDVAHSSSMYPDINDHLAFQRWRRDPTIDTAIPNSST